MNEPTERWLPVVSYDGVYRDLYEVSNLNQVRSLPRWTKTGLRSGQILKPWLQNAGYPAVKLAREGTQRTCLVHRLVLEAFAGERPPGQVARHGPNGKLDASADELCWGTYVQNETDKLRDGTDQRGERNHMAKLTESDVREIRRLAAAGALKYRIAEQYGLCKSAVGQIVRRKSWTHVT